MGAWSENHPSAPVKNLTLGWPLRATLARFITLTRNASARPRGRRLRSRRSGWWHSRRHRSNPGGAAHRRISRGADADDAGTFPRVVRRALRTKNAPGADSSEPLDSAI